MSKRIGLLSDVHAAPGPLSEALDIFAREGVEMILCPGDIVGYGEAPEETVELLKRSGCQAVVGNHDRWYVERGEGSPETRSYLGGLPAALDISIGDRSLYLVHASPPESDMEGIKLLDEKGELIPEAMQWWGDRLAGFGCDVLVVGHTHQVFAEWLGGMLVINPGSTVFNHSCAILHLPECRIEWFALEGEEISRSWNWGMGVSRIEG